MGIEINPPKKPCNCSDPMSGAKVYRKIANVRAKQMDRDFVVKTREGVMTGRAGDYMCEGVEGERWPIQKEIFEKTYVLVEDQNA